MLTGAPDRVFFCKQKTAYEIVDCDWSSDVCSSDLRGANATETLWHLGLVSDSEYLLAKGTDPEEHYQDRKSVVSGKSVDLGGRRIIKKKKNNPLHSSARYLASQPPPFYSLQFPYTFTSSSFLTNTS